MTLKLSPSSRDSILWLPFEAMDGMQDKSRHRILVHQKTPIVVERHLVVGKHSELHADSLEGNGQAPGLKVVIPSINHAKVY